MTQQTIFNKPAELDEFYNRIMRIAGAMCGTASWQTSALPFPSAMVASPRFEDAPALRVKMPNGFQVDFAPSNPLSIGKSLSVIATGTLGQERKSDWSFTLGLSGWRRTKDHLLTDDEIRACLTPEDPPAIDSSKRSVQFRVQALAAPDRARSGSEACMSPQRGKVELATQFDEAVMKAVQEGAQLGYSAGDYLSKRRAEGPMALALRLIKDRQPSYGLRKLRAMKRLDLSIEAIVWDNPQFQVLFPPKVVERCREKLEALDYFKPKEPKRILPPLPKVDWDKR